VSRISKRATLLLLAALGALRCLPLAAATPLVVHIHTDDAMFQVLISPGTVGSDGFVLQLMTGEGALMNVKEATLTLNPPGAGAAQFTRKATKGDDGYWHVDDVPIASAGRWHMRIDAKTPFRTISLEDEFDVPPQ
jgi:copper transport protein